jgi:hypothetical protein
MLPIDKALIAYLGSVEQESRIVAQFNQDYVVAGEPEGDGSAQSLHIRAPKSLIYYS